MIEDKIWVRLLHESARTLNTRALGKTNIYSGFAASQMHKGLSCTSVWTMTMRWLALKTLTVWWKIYPTRLSPPWASLWMSIFTNWMVQDIIEGNIIQMADRVVDMLKSKYLIMPVTFKGMNRPEVPDIGWLFWLIRIGRNCIAAIGSFTNTCRVHIYKRKTVMANASVGTDLITFRWHYFSPMFNWV